MAPDTAAARSSIHTALGIVTGEIAGGERELANYLDSALTLLDGATGCEELLRRALPMLERLGDFIGNGDPTPGRADSLGSRCDLILDIKDYLDGKAARQAPSPDTVTLHFDATSIREHYEGCELDRQGVIDALSDETLQAAGEVIVNRLSDNFWEAVDDLYSQAVDVAVATERA